MDSHHKIDIKKVMVNTMSYQELHEIINLEHQTDNGKSNVRLRVHTYLDSENHQGINMSSDML